MDWLMKLLGMQQGGGGSPFGGLGGGGVGPSPQSSVGPAMNNGMPMNIAPPTMQPGATMNLQPQNPAQNSGLWGTLAQKFGGGLGAPPNTGQPGSPGATPLTPNTNQNTAAQNFGFNQIGNLLKQPQLQPTQWMPWMQR